MYTLFAMEWRHVYSVCASQESVDWLVLLYIVFGTQCPLLLLPTLLFQQLKTLGMD